MRHRFFYSLAFFMVVAAIPRVGLAETVEFHFANVGMSYSAALFADDPIVGKSVEGARIVLEVEAFEGSDAANFFTDILLPIDPLPGNDPTLVYTGEELGWMGAGIFRLELETSQLNGTLIARRFGAESPAENFNGRILEGIIELNIPSYVRGDFDDDQDLDVADVDLLAQAMRSPDYSRLYDLNQDSLIDMEDRREWVIFLKGTWFGDADLDGRFESSDLVEVFQSGLYEDGIDGNAGWKSGDWDGDGDFGSGDLVLAFQDGGFEAGPRQQPEARLVPEPQSLGLCGIMLLGWVVRAMRYGNRRVGV